MAGSKGREYGRINVFIEWSRIETNFVFDILADFYEQSSDDIWATVCRCVSDVVVDDETKRLVRGVGFDATCSMVVVGQDGKGLRFVLGVLAPEPQKM